MELCHCRDPLASVQIQQQRTRYRSVMNGGHNPELLFQRDFLRPKCHHAARLAVASSVEIPVVRFQVGFRNVIRRGNVSGKQLEILKRDTYIAGPPNLNYCPIVMVNPITIALGKSFTELIK